MYVIELSSTTPKGHHLLTPLTQPIVTTAENCGNRTTDSPAQEGSMDALLYIVVVLAFYAFAMVVLMIKYVRRENQEAQLRHIFIEYVKRDYFHEARQQNLQQVQKLKETLDPKLLDPSVTSQTRVPLSEG